MTILKQISLLDIRELHLMKKSRRLMRFSALSTSTNVTIVLQEDVERSTK